MAIIVQKYGGTSVGNAERIRAVARRIVDTTERGNQVVAVVSAFSSFGTAPFDNQATAPGAHPG